METTPFGTTADGEIIRLFTIRNLQGLEISLSEYGAILTSVKIPDREGQIEEVTLGLDGLEAWLENPHLFGATVGRFGNRIAAGKFSIDGKDYQLATNNAPAGIPCHLHGGEKGFNQVVWTGQPVQRPQAVGVCFTYHSDEGEEGYPGNLTAKVSYWLSEANELIIEVSARSDAPCPVNLINHTYWNLSGEMDQEILGHELQLNASQYLPTTPGLIPTGELAAVAGTAMDFRQALAVGKRIEDSFEALKFAQGYDHCWVLDGEDTGMLRPAATLYDPESGRVMEISTTHPGIQLYTGNSLPKRTGLCLETQGFPDAPNQVNFPNSILRPGENYSRKTVHRFSVK